MREQPRQRALLGAGFAIGLGFLPAAWTMRHRHEGVMRRLDQERVALAADPRLGLEPSVQQDLDAVNDSLEREQAHGLIEAFVLWILVGGAGAVWFARHT